MNMEDNEDVSNHGESHQEMSAEEWKGIGNEHYKKKEYVEAITAYTEAISIGGDSNPSFHMNRAAAQMMLQKYTEALEDCNRSLALDSTNAKAHLRKAGALKALGQMQLATLKESINGGASSVSVAYRAVLGQLNGLYSVLGENCVDLNVLKGLALLGMGKTEDAYNLTNQMMRSQTSCNGNTEFMLLRAKCLTQMGDVENAVRSLQHALRTDPDNAFVRMTYKYLREVMDLKKEGDNAYRSADYESAVAEWTKCLESCIQHVDAKSKAGLISGPIVGAIYRAKLYCNRAQAKGKLKKYQEAVDDCTLSISTDGTFLKGYLRRAEFNFAIGGKEALNMCIQDYTKVGSLQDSNGTADDDKIPVKKKIQEVQVALKRAGKKDLYRVLAVPNGADEDSIKKAYKKAALKYHPDKQATKSAKEQEDASTKFKEINEAYGILSDPAKRKRYDAGVDVENLDQPESHDQFHGGMRGGGGGMPGGMGGIDPEMLFQMFGGGGMPGGMPGGMGGRRRGGGGAGGNPFPGFSF
eukprot:GSChrysophyteH1.ASY1.ANO1.550.1 assembled CDS